jgi:choice-of-anchor C domain-containing protein
MISIPKQRLAGLASASAVIAAMAVATVSASAMAASPIFANGSFETGSYARENFPGWDFDRVESGATDIDGWTVTEGNVDWVKSDWPAANGSMSIDLDGAEDTAGAISQTFDTVTNATYVVTFDMSGNPGNPAVDPNKTMTVAAADTTQPYAYNTATSGTTSADMKWANRTFTFQAKRTSTTLTFASTTGSGWGPAIDNVVVTQTLTPGASCKNGGWKTMVDKTETAFRNQGDCVSYYATGEKNLAY